MGRCPTTYATIGCCGRGFDLLTNQTRRKGELRVGVCHKVSANWDDHFWAEREAGNGYVASIQAQRIVNETVSTSRKANVTQPCLAKAQKQLEYYQTIFEYNYSQAYLKFLTKQ